LKVKGVWRGKPLATKVPKIGLVMRDCLTLGLFFDEMRNRLRGFMVETFGGIS